MRYGSEPVKRSWMRQCPCARSKCIQNRIDGSEACGKKSCPVHDMTHKHPVWTAGCPHWMRMRHITDGMDLFHQFVKLSVIALRVRHGKHITLGDGCVNFCKVHVGSEEN